MVVGAEIPYISLGVPSSRLSLCRLVSLLVLSSPSLSRPSPSNNYPHPFLPHSHLLPKRQPVHHISVSYPNPTTLTVPCPSDLHNQLFEFSSPSHKVLLKQPSPTSPINNSFRVTILSFHIRWLVESRPLWEEDF